MHKIICVMYPYFQIRPVFLTIEEAILRICFSKHTLKECSSNTVIILKNTVNNNIFKSYDSICNKLLKGKTFT